MRSIAVEAIKSIESNWTYLEHEIFGPRLPLDIPQVIFSFVSSFMQRFHTFGIRSYKIAFIFNLIKYISARN